MWAMIAEPGLRCAECRHTIQPGRLCLSELPEETPAGVSRGDFRNYCIGCPQCWAQGKHACYVRHLDGGRGIIAAALDTEVLPCRQIGTAIGALALLLAAAMLTTGCITIGSTDDVPATVAAELTRVSEEATRAAPTWTPKPAPPTVTPTSTPTPIPTATSGTSFVQISAGSFHTAE